METLLFILLFISLASMIAGVIRPSLFAFLLKGKATRKIIFLVFGFLSLGFFIALGLLPGTKNLEEIDAITERPTTDEEWIQGVIFQGALAEVSLRYSEATVYTDTLFRDAQELSDEERIALLDQTIQKWAEAKTAADQFSAVAELLPDYDAAVSYQSNDSRSSLTTEVLAATVEEDIDKAWQKKKELGEEKLLQLIDKAPPGQRMKEAAKIFGTSIEVAEVVLQDLRAEETKKALKEAEKYDKYSKAAQTIQAGVKVTIFVGGVAAGGGMVTLAGKAAHIVISSVAGAGLTMDVSKTAVSVGIADENGPVAAIAKAKDAQFFKEMSYVVAITDIAKALGQFEKVASAAGGVKNLLTPGGLKKIAENKQLINDMKSDASGNLQTIVDSGPAAWDFLTKNPEVKTVVLDTATPGKIVLTGTDKEAVIKGPVTAKAINDFVQGILDKAQKLDSVTPQKTAEPAPAAVPSVRIVKACSSGLLTVYTDCSSGKKVSKEWAHGRGRANIGSDGTSFTPKISGGKGNYQFIVWLDNGESIIVANYNGATNVATLTEEAKNLGWTISGGTVFVPKPKPQE